MAKYIVKKDGIFGTLYVANANYDKHAETTREEAKAYKFLTLKHALKIQKSLRGSEILEVKENESTPLQTGEVYELTHCKDCAYFDSVMCRRTQLNCDPMDFCSRGLLNK